MATTIPGVPKDAARQAIQRSRKLMRMLRGTMGLEGQGLDGKARRAIFRQMTLDLLADHFERIKAPERR